MALPVLTAEERAAALLKAAETRAKQSRALAELTAGEVGLAKVLYDLESPLRRVPVARVLRALPGIGKVTAEKIMAEVGISEGRRLSGLGDKQREKLAAHPDLPAAA